MSREPPGRTAPSRRTKQPIVFVAAVIAAALAACTASEQSHEGRLRVVSNRPAPTIFRMSYEALGTQVLDCFFVNRAFVLDVDTDAMQMVLRHKDNGSVRAYRSADELIIDRRFFSEPPTANSWLVVDLGRTQEAGRLVLQRALGSDLAGYLLAPTAPPTGEEILAAALDVATQIEPSNGEKAEGEWYRVTVDHRRFAEAAGTSASGADNTTVPIIDLRIDGDRVAAVVIQPAPPADPTGAGWRIEFSTPAVPLPSLPAPQTRATLSNVAVENLTPSPIEGCSLGETPPGTGDETG